MKEMQQAINSAFEKMNADGTIEKIIELQLTDTIKKTVSDSIREYSDFGKALKQAIVNAVSCNVEDFGLAGLRDTVFKIVQAKVGLLFEEEVAEKLGKDLEKLLKPAPAEMNLSDLVDAFKKELIDDGGSGEISFHCEETNYKNMWISLDKECGKTERQCEVRFLVSNEGGPISALSLDRAGDLDKRILYGRNFGFEKLLFQLVSAKTKIIPDVDDVSTSYGDY